MFLYRLTSHHRPVFPELLSYYPLSFSDSRYTVRQRFLTSGSRTADMFPAGWTQMWLAWRYAERFVAATVIADAFICGGEFGALN